MIELKMEVQISSMPVCANSFGIHVEACCHFLLLPVNINKCIVCLAFKLGGQRWVSACVKSKWVGGRKEKDTLF